VFSFFFRVDWEIWVTAMAAMKGGRESYICLRDRRRRSDWLVMAGVPGSGKIRDDELGFWSMHQPVIDLLIFRQRYSAFGQG
jgi:hypothetical protein